ncbi:MAG: pantoate--beta-alanine ligase [Nevskiales bacterium]
MQIVDNSPALREQIAAWRRAGERIAFVPTMGSLHDGHLALVEHARRVADRVVVSIFVNPTQFGLDEDFERYPRKLDDDIRELGRVTVDLLFTPSIEVMYPLETIHAVDIEVKGITDILCGAFRPGHFNGVATVVTMLFNLVQPDIAVFGEKDYQQLAVIRRMTRALHMPVDIVGSPTVREADGLAMSSRNRYLTAQERKIAPKLYAALQEARDALRAGNTDFEAIADRGMAALQTAGFAPEYFAVHNTRLEPPKETDGEWVVLAAARLGQARLIDNIQTV